MRYQILIVDCSEKHRLVMRHFVKRVYPGVKLVEHNPCEQGLPGRDFPWSSFQLLITDSDLGDQDGLYFVMTSRKLAGFPPVIFLSSFENPGTPEATRMVIDAIKLGADNFLFKKNIQVAQLNKSIIKILKTAGYRRKKAAVDTSVPQKPARPERPDPDAVEQAMQDTVHEMELAMAMIHGHAEWPFSMTDILQGKARIGDYKIISYLGRGNNATTFKACEERSDKLVILKMVGQSLDKKSAAFKQCMADLKQLIEWNHPNLVKVFQQGFVEGRLIIVQEFLAGQKLSEVLRRTGALQDKLAARYFLQILSALNQLHVHGMSVGSVSPHNILFRDKQTLALSNFGIVRRMHALNQITGQAGLGAAAAYIPPEKIKKHKTDARTDLYSAGVIYYEMLAGHPPFHVGSAQDILYQQVEAAVPALPMKDHPMNRVIQGLMMKTPSQRFQSANEVIDMVEAVYGKSK